MPMSLEVINRSAILLHIPDDHGNAVKVILGGADGPLVTIDPAGHIHVSPVGWSGGSGSPQSRERNIAGNSGDCPVGERSESRRSWSTLVFEFRIIAGRHHSKYTRFTALRLGKVDSKLETLRSFQKGSDS